MKKCLIVAAALAAGLWAAAQTRVSTSYALPAETLDAGGRPSTSANYSHAGSIGLVDGTASSASFIVAAGFLPRISDPTPGPEIAVFDGAVVSPAAERQSGSGRFNFPRTSVGAASAAQSFTIKNTGTTDLTGLAVSVGGANAAEFAVSTLGVTTLAPGAVATFTITFTPAVAGARSAALQIASNDPDENPFVIALAANDTLAASYTTGTEVPLVANGFNAAGSTLNLALNFAPAVGTQLMVVRNTSRDFISGRFGNLAQGQTVALSYGGNTYQFVANYYGGTGNDLVLVWAATRVFDWGKNTNGQLGDNSTTSRTTPVLVTATGALAGKTVLSLASGAAHSVALCSDGTLLAWGRNDAGQLGDGTTTDRRSPVPVVTAGTPLAGKLVVAIAAGDSHTLALCSDGTLAAWGYNAGGQLGDSTLTSRLVPVAVAMAGTPLAGKSVCQIVAGRYHSLALCSDGSIAAWGLNFYGELGDGTTTDRFVPVAVTLAGTPLASRSVVALAAGAYHSLALCADGTVAAWGDNSHGQLGDGTAAQRTLPVSVLASSSPLAGKTIVAVAGGASHSLALCADNTLGAWGDNTSGQLGNGSSGQPINPLPSTVIAGLPPLVGKTIAGLAAGSVHSVAWCTDGTLAAWGSNAAGQLGDGSLATRVLPTAVSSGALVAGERFVRVVSGNFSDHTVALVASPTLPEISVFQGNSTAAPDALQSNVGTLAFPATAVGATSAVQTFTIKNTGTADLTGLALATGGTHAADFAAGALGATTLAPGASTTFAVTFAPTALGARNALVQITSNDPDENPFVLAVSGTAVSVLASYSSVATVPVAAASYTATGKTVDFRLNFAPSAGTTLVIVKNTGPAPIAGRFDNLAQGQTVSLSYGGNTYDFLANYYGGTGNDLVLTWAYRRLFSWGLNANGQLGDASATSRSTPVPVSSAGVLAGKTVLAQALGQSHTLVLCTDGTLAAWGRNDVGQLGDGTTTDRSVPVAVRTVGTPLAGKSVVSIAAGVSHNLALCSDGTLVAWGANSWGQLGDGSTANRLAPVAVTVTGALAGKSVVSLAPAYLHSVVLCSDGTAVSWGYNANGQLGNNTASGSLVPVAVNTAGALSGKTIVTLSANVNHTLALCSDGTIVSWGYNFAGELGNGTTSTGYSPQLVNTVSALAGKTVEATAAGEHHSLALCTDGTLVAWGQGASGQLGNGSTGDLYSPFAVTTGGTALAGKTVVSISAGTGHSLALCSDGTLVAWGKNSSGQLGDGSTTNRLLPVSVPTTALGVGDRFMRAAGGAYSDHTVAVVGLAGPAPEIAVYDGSIVGSNERQSGAGTFTFTATMVGAASGAQTFTIQNTGTAALSGLALSKSGALAGDFALGALGSSTLQPGATTSFTVEFRPTSAGARSATVLIASNDSNENPFTIAVAGTAVSQLEAWRDTHFGTMANTGSAADTADPDGDGLANLLEFALGLDPLVVDSVGLPSASATSTDWVFTYQRANTASALTFSVEVSADLVQWSSAPLTQHAMIASGGGVETWQASCPLSYGPRVFFRLKVTTQ